MHTGSDRRSNLPQIRCDVDDPHTLDLARAFGARSSSTPSCATVR